MVTVVYLGAPPNIPSTSPDTVWLSSTGNFTSATCISTPVYNDEWVQYYAKEEHGMPTVLFLDRRKYANWETFRECEFGAYLTEKYRWNENSWETGKEFYMLRLEEKR